ncbi:hypothetical protein SCALIN_C04_0048 [Candidatus Scalindua japonica]|uniref:Uncharacterized protein n=1 Tax=Candidatus Scalindua japonica TaxID=1284222 RepID=A0A286TUH8_9BACT|nr:hypothetical protein [Candidatus Scalindua japonica]GAX59560.1 hypothetical protein SCALIN_C04_0048 [Candidatus Scalindua japonica]
MIKGLCKYFIIILSISMCFFYMMDPSVFAQAADSDADGIPDWFEQDCTIPGHVGCPPDTDGDGIPDYLDPDDDGDGIATFDEGTEDLDNDGIPNFLDTDSDGDGKPDIDEGLGDDDGDGILNYIDVNDNDGPDGDLDGDGLTNSQEDALGSNKNSSDTDGDGVLDGVEVTDPENPVDTDNDGLLDISDDDDDGDGILTADELFTGSDRWVQDPDGWPDYWYDLNDPDGDGIPNYLDEDSDNDGRLDDPVNIWNDRDRDRVPNYLDTDDHDGPAGDADSDGLSNIFEDRIGTEPFDDDSDNDGVGDGREWAEGYDTDRDGIIDVLDPDDDGDCIPGNKEGRVDSDHDGITNDRDKDSDNDGRPDIYEGTGDNDCDGIPNYTDPVETDGPCALGDDDGDHVPNFADYDEADGPCAGKHYFINNLDFIPGKGRVIRTGSGLQVTFEKQVGTATLHCSGNTDCETNGIDGARLTIQQDMQIVIDVIGAGIIGDSRGKILVKMSDGSTRWLKFKASVKGQILCLDDSPTACTIMTIVMNQTIDLPGQIGKAVTQMDFKLQGIISLGKKGGALLEDLTGIGTLQFAPLNPAEF